MENLRMTMMMSQRIRRDSVEQTIERRLPVVDAEWYQTHGQGD